MNVDKSCRRSAPVPSRAAGTGCASSPRQHPAALLCVCCQGISTRHHAHFCVYPSQASKAVPTCAEDGRSPGGSLLHGDSCPSARWVKGAGLCPSFTWTEQLQALPNLAGNRPWWGCFPLLASIHPLAATALHPMQARASSEGQTSPSHHRAINTLPPAVPRGQAPATLLPRERKNPLPAYCPSWSCDRPQASATRKLLVRQGVQGKAGAARSATCKVELVCPAGRTRREGSPQHRVPPGPSAARPGPP